MIEKRVPHSRISESMHRFDEALADAFEHDPELRFEYEATVLAHQIAGMLRAVRQKADLTQQDLAKAINVPQSFISRLENPEADKLPSLQTLAKLAWAFGKRVSVEFHDLTAEEESDFTTGVFKQADQLVGRIARKEER